VSLKYLSDAHPEHIRLSNTVNKALVVIILVTSVCLVYVFRHKVKSLKCIVQKWTHYIRYKNKEPQSGIGSDIMTNSGIYLMLYAVRPRMCTLYMRRAIFGEQFV